MAYDGMNDFEGEGAMPGGKPSPGQAPECTAKYYPAQGGQEASSFESAGAQGDKGEGGGSEPTGDTTAGDYASTAHTIGDYPHGNEDPACEGPPIGTDSSGGGGPTAANP